MATGTGGIDAGAARETPVLALVDRRRLEQVLANLVRNAAEHAHGATGARRHRDDADGTVRIWVDDRGPGVPPAAQGADLRALRPGGTPGERVGG